jgi:shikimate kinase
VTARPANGTVVIVGAMGSGKTTIGELLADALDLPFLDSDEQIVARTGRTGREIAAAEGVPELHRLEREVLLEALSGPGPRVVAAAASVIEDRGVREVLADASCVLTTADPGVLADRVGSGGHRREVGANERLDHRRQLFDEVADVVIDTGRVSPREGIDRILSALRGE